MSHSDKNIESITEEVVEQNGFLLIDTIIRGTSNFKVIEIFIDGEGDITAEDCAEISRQIKQKLDELLLLDSNYRLDVSSPGVDRPLKFLQQYHKHINRKFELSYRQKEETKKFKGKLIKIEGDNLHFLNDNKNEVIINFNNITKAKVTISFS